MAIRDFAHQKRDLLILGEIIRIEYIKSGGPYIMFWLSSGYFGQIKQSLIIKDWRLKIMKEQCVSTKNNFYF